MKEMEMADKDNPQAPQTSAPEFNNPDFQFALKALLDAYQPILEQQLNLAKNPAALEKEAESAPPNASQELALANQIFEKFLTEEVAFRMIPAAGRNQLGDVESWGWCIQHLRCCVVFGWLVCRGPRTFRAWNIYLYEYWRCVRATLGKPVADPPTEEQSRDFRLLVEGLAEAFKPYLTDQLASVEYPSGISDEVLSGKINYAEGLGETCAIFERFMNSKTAAALLGREAFSEYRQKPNFWFCRCWCLCAICFGCCLARARTLDGVLWCLVYFFRCLGECVKNLSCDLTGPTGCIRGYTDILPGKVLQPVTGSAYGFGFGHYVIEVRDGASVLLSGVVIYPDGIGAPDPSFTQGNFAVASGNLGWLDLVQCVTAAGVDILTSSTFTVTLRVFATDGSELTPDCVTTFELSLADVYIERVSTPWSVNFTDPSEPLRVADSASSALATVGGAMNVRGAANIAGCADQVISEYTIWVIPDPTFSFPQPPNFMPVTPAASWIQITHIVYTAQSIPQPAPNPPITYNADQVRAYNVLDGDMGPDVLTNVWGSDTEYKFIVVNLHLIEESWNIPALIANPLYSASGILPKTAPILQPGTGKFTFLLQAIDTAGNQFYDVQRAWIDNEQVVAKITGIGGLPPCGDLYTQNSSGVFQTVNVNGYAWDQLIDPVTPDYTQPTSDNFNYYIVTFQKQGAAEWITLISSTSTVPPRHTPFGVGVLANWNLQWLDATTNPNNLPADQLLAQGQECTYVVNVAAYDSTVVDEITTHSCVPPTPGTEFPIKIINGPQPI
jgi:hypothetical protein